jgi:hypothetical protein
VGGGGVGGLENILMSMVKFDTSNTLPELNKSGTCIKTKILENNLSLFATDLQFLQFYKISSYIAIKIPAHVHSDFKKIRKQNEYCFFFSVADRTLFQKPSAITRLYG